MSAAYHAFISHSTRDKAIADAVCEKLEAAGIRCWIAPRNIDPGREYPEAIIDGINRSHMMILIFSSHANDSPDIKREIKHASDKRRTIIPFRVEDVKPVGGLEYFLGSVQWLDALPPHPEKHIPELVAEVRERLDMPVVDPSEGRAGLLRAMREKLREAGAACRSRAKKAAVSLGALVTLAGGVSGYQLGWIPAEWIPAWPRSGAERGAPPQHAPKAELHLNQGLTFAAMKDFDNARLEFTQAIEFDRRYAVAYANRAVVHMQEQKYNLALDDLRTAEKLAPKDKMVQYNLAALYSLQNQRDRGLVALDRALEQGFDNYEALRRDPDLANLRRDPGFRKVLERHKVFLR
jgi:hypothetical protein